MLGDIFFMFSTTFKRPISKKYSTFEGRGSSNSIAIVRVKDSCGFELNKVALVKPRVNAVGGTKLVHLISMVLLMRAQLNGYTVVDSQSILTRMYSLTERSILVLKEIRYREGEFSVLG